MPQDTTLYYSHQVNNQMSLAEQELVANVSLSRLDWLKRFFDPRRDIDQECGYPSMSAAGNSAFGAEHYRQFHERMSIARRVNELMPKEALEVQPTVYETEDPDDITDFEEDWDALPKQIHGGMSWHLGKDELGNPIWNYLKRATVQARIGHYGAVLIGVADDLRLDQPAEGVVSLTPVNNEYGEPVPAPSTPVPAPTLNREGKNGEKSEYLQEQEFIANWVIEEQVREEAVRNAKQQVKTSSAGYYDQSTEPTGGMGGDYSSPNPSTGGSRLGGGVLTQPGGGFSSAGQGTDALYVGVQMGPPEYPAEKPSKQRRKLTFLRVFDETLVQIVQYEANIRSPRFGQPVMYRITLNDPRQQYSGIGLPIATVRVHWSRVIHIAEGKQASEVFGTPSCQPVLNDLLDLKKIYGASAEGYWKSAFTGIQFETHPQLGGDVQLVGGVRAFQDTMENYQNSLQKSLVGVGGRFSTLAPSVVDPTPFIASRLEAICICLGCPMRVFKGAERGELASVQDDANWNDRKREWQLNFFTPEVAAVFIDRLIMMGVLRAPKKAKNEAEGGGLPQVSNKVRLVTFKVFNADTGTVEERSKEETSVVVKTPGGYCIEWPDLDSTTDMDKAKILLTRTQAYAAYASGGLNSMIHPHEYMTEFDNLSDERAASILDAAMESTPEDDPLFADQQEEQDREDEQMQQQASREDQHRAEDQAHDINLTSLKTAAKPMNGKVGAK